MRQADEITDRPAARSLPAPTGRRSPTGPVPLTLPLHAIPPPLDAVPVLPYLPAAVPKVSAPVTSQVATTLAASTTPNLNGGTPSTAPQPQRGHRRLIVLAVIVVVTLLLALAFRNTAFIQRFTGSGYDTNPLPTHAFPQPPFDGAEYTVIEQTVGMAEGLPTNFWQTSRAEINFVSGTGKFTIDYAKAPVIGGTIGTPQSTSPTVELVVDPRSSYRPGATAADAWIRMPNEPGWHTMALLSRNEIYMYQDVIDPSLRAQQPVSVVDEIRHEIPVTTYTYNFTFGDFYESAPHLFDLFRVLDGNAADDATVAVTISLDEQWLVRYLDVNLDYHAVLEHRATVDVDNQYPYRYTIELNSIMDAPPDIVAPANAVDESTTTTITAAVTP